MTAAPRNLRHYEQQVNTRFMTSQPPAIDERLLPENARSLPLAWRRIPLNNIEAFAFFRLHLRLMMAARAGVSSSLQFCSSGSTNNDKRIGLQSREGIKKVAEEKVNPSNNNII